MAKGRVTPCNLKYKPHALQTGSPSLLRRQSVVVVVIQLLHDSPSLREVACKQITLLSTCDQDMFDDVGKGAFFDDPFMGRRHLFSHIFCSFEPKFYTHKCWGNWEQFHLAECSTSLLSRSKRKYLI